MAVGDVDVTVQLEAAPQINVELMPDVNVPVSVAKDLLINVAVSAVGPTGPAGKDGAVLSVNGQTGNAVLSKSDVGLSNVDNTSDLNKPVSTATQTALNAKEPTIASGTSAQYIRGDKALATLNQDAVPDGTTNKAYTATEKTKLSGIATGATANATDAQLRDRSTHTGTQTSSTISDFSTSADARITAATGVSVQPYSANTTTLGNTATGTGAIVRATSPALVTPTGIVKGDVGLGNVDNTSDATKNAASVTLTNKNISGASNTLSNISADSTIDGATNKVYTATEKTKLAGIATGATANSSDATLLNRANHTGTQTASTISDFSTAADARITAANKKTDSMTTNRLLGRGTAGTGAIEEITLGTNLSLTGTTLNATGGSGGGDVTGPASAVNGNLTSFNGTTGKIIQDSGKAAPTGAIVGTTDAQTLTNKTISGSSNTLSNIANASLTNSSVTIGSTSVALGATAATLAGLTLSTPKIAQINDANGNAAIVNTATASAVNQVTVTNAATTTDPSIAASGSDTNIALKLSGKGNRSVTIEDGNGLVIKGNTVSTSPVAGYGKFYMQGTTNARPRFVNEGATAESIVTSSDFKRQDNTTNSTLGAGARIETGIGIITGGTSKAVTFSSAFTGIPVVVVSNVGGNSSAATYAYPSAGGGSGVFTDRVISAVSQSTTGFTAMAAGTAPSASQNITFTWVAIGT